MQQIYLVKSSTGSIQSFFYRDGLCFQTQSTKTAQDKAQPAPSGVQRLLDNVAEDFDVLIDENDVTHIVCQDISGNILYVCNEGDRWRRRVLLQSKTPAAYPKYFRLFKEAEVLSLFYVLQYEGKPMLVHQLLGSQPQVVDYIDRDVFCIAPCFGQSFYAFYRPNGERRLCYRLFDWSQKSWGKRYELELEDVSAVYALPEEDDFHLLYLAKAKLFYQKYESFDGQTLQPAGNGKLIVEDARTRNSLLLSAGERLYILWNGSSGPCFALSSDGGKTIGAPQKLPYARQTSLYHLRAYREEILRKSTYGYLLGGRLSLLANDRFLLPDVSRREVRYTSATRDVEKLAGLPEEAAPAESRADVQRLEIELNKVKIRLTQTEKEMAELKAAFEAAPAACKPGADRLEMDGAYPKEASAAEEYNSQVFSAPFYGTTENTPSYSPTASAVPYEAENDNGKDSDG